MLTPIKQNTVIHHLKLKNDDKFALLDDDGYNFLKEDPSLSKFNLVDNLRLHSSGCAVFQRTITRSPGQYENQTLYLHKIIAEKFLIKTKSKTNKLVGAINGNKLDCRVENLIFRSRSTASRQRKNKKNQLYTGVYQIGNKYRAVIAHNKKTLHIGMFDTAEKAALAYNLKSAELFGAEGKQNVIK